MNRLVLTLAEAAQFHAGLLTEIRRPFDKANEVVPTAYRALLGTVGLPADAVHPDGSGKGWIAHWGRCPHTAEETARDYPGEQGIWPPLGQPGETLWIAEEWGAGSRPDPFEGWRDGIEYRADEAYLDDVELLPLHAVTLPEDVEDLSEWMGEGWQSANTMPQWASRANARLTSVRAERTGDLWEFVYGVEKVDPSPA